MLNSIGCRWVRVGCFATCLSVCASGAMRMISFAEEGLTAVQSGKARRLDQMRSRALRATIRIIPKTPNSPESEAQTQTVELHPQPLFRYDDQPRGFRDATLWVWTHQGRPVAIEKVEDSMDVNRGPTWVTCLASVSPHLIRATWDGGYDWTSTKPGIQFKSIKDGPNPETTEAGRLRQFKALSERFTAAIQVYSGDRQELRLLPRRLHRYQIAAEQVTDAVMFGWTSNGTNPDAVLILELHTSASGAAEWAYSLAPVTADKLWLKMDDIIVQTKAQTIYPSDETLIFFFEKNAEVIE